MSALAVDIEDLEMPKVERKVIFNSKNMPNVKRNVLYLLNDSIVSKTDFEKIDSDLIESVNIIKDTIEIKKYTKDKFDGIISVTLKNKTSETD